LDSPDAFLYQKEHPFQGSDSTLLGTAVHHMLQGNSHLVVYSTVDKRKKQNMQNSSETSKKKHVEGSHHCTMFFQRKIGCDTGEREQNPYVKEVLEGCMFEVPKVIDTGSIQFKGKVDAVKHHKDWGIHCIVEIKTSSMASDLESFRKEAYNRHYDMQAHMYCRLFPITTGA